MAEIFKFFNSGVGDPRKYQATDFAEYFGSVLSTGLLHTDEVPGMKVSVEAGTLNTIVSSGKAIMKGHLYENTTPLTLTHSIPEPTLDRIDRIVLRLNLQNSERNILLHVKEGVSSSVPVAPTLQRDNFIHEVSLAQIMVRKNTTQLLQVDLVDERLKEDLCGLVYSLISIPTSQFQEQWDLFFSDKSVEIQQDANDFKDEWQAWFDTIKQTVPGDAKLVSVEDVGNLFTSTDVEGVLAELFTNANNGKTDIASVVGSPATVGDTFVQLKTHIQNSKNTLATPLGIANTSTLAVLASTLTTRRNSIATAVNTKGVPATNADTLAQLATKIGQINTGKKWAKGVATSSANTNQFLDAVGATRQSAFLEVSGLDFTPKTVIIVQSNSASNFAYTTLETSPLQSGFTLILTSDAYNYRLTGNAQLTSNGFKLPVSRTNWGFDWIAYE